MAQTLVGIVRGGPSREYRNSLETGARIIAALPEDRYRVRDIVIDRNGVWHMHGIPVDPMRVLQSIDVVFNALHGTYGEDGNVQRILERSGTPFVGSRARGAALATHKVRAKEALRGSSIRMPRGIAFIASSEATTADMAHEVFQQFGPPYVVKPITLGSSIGVTLSHSLIDLPDILADVLDAYGSALVEEYIPGTEATVGIIESFRDEPLYALPPIEIIPDNRLFFDFAAKYEGASRRFCPGNFDRSTTLALEAAARDVHQRLGLQHYSRSDFRVRPNGAVYFLEANALPGLAEHSLMPQALETVGASFPGFVEHCISCAR